MGVAVEQFVAEELVEAATAKEYSVLERSWSPIG